MWKNEYLKNLPTFTGKSSDKGINVGSMVLVEDEGPKIGWPLGIVEKVYPGRDNIVRQVDVKTQRGVITRPIQRLRSLEVTHSTPSKATSQTHDTDTNSSEENDNQEDVVKVKTVTTMRGRTVKRRDILDL